MATTPSTTSSHRYFLAPVIMAGVFVLLQIATADTYGLHTDDYYYVACARHLDIGYVDHPGFVAWITRISLMFGSSPYVLHTMPALAGAGVLLLTALLVRIFGGSAFAAGLAVLAVLSGMYVWVVGGMASMNIYDILWVTTAAYGLLLALGTDATRWWVALGAIIGIGINTKTTMVVFAIALLVGVVLTGERKRLATRGPYRALAIAVVMTVPFLVWQYVHGFPTLEFIRNVSHGKNADHPPLTLLVQLGIAAGLLTVPLWIAGLWSLLRGKGVRHGRVLGLAVMVFMLAYLTANAKFYYLYPAIPLLIAAGAVAFERISGGYRWMRIATVGVLVAGTLIQLPIGVPLLSIESFATYASHLGLVRALKTENHPQAQGPVLRGVPDYFGQRFGCRQLVERVAGVYWSVPASERAHTVIFGKTYAYAGMIDLVGPSYGLPGAISAHNSYWLWGYGTFTGSPMIAIGMHEAYWRRYYTSVQRVATHEFPWREDKDRVLGIFLCRGPSRSFSEIWTELKTYD